MNTSTVSSKYQIVIPKELREKLQIKPGQRVGLRLGLNQSIQVSKADPLSDLQKQFSGKNIWGKDPVRTIRKMRDEWDD